MPREPDADLQRLLDEAPFVRALARTLLAEDSDEVVQQTWLRALEHGGRQIEEPRSWLRRVVRNVANNLRRGRQRRASHEQVAAKLAVSSAELMQREERRRELVSAVDQLPEPVRTAVLLRYFEGLPPARIAAQIGVPVTTVWNRLREGLRLLRVRLGRDRRAWLLPLLVELPAAATGVIVMTTKTKLLAAVLLLVIAGALALWFGDPGSPVPAVAAPAPSNGLLTAALPAQATEPVPEPGRRELPAATPAVATTGDVEVHVRYADHAPAAGVPVLARRGPDIRKDVRRVLADDGGTARVHGVGPGKLTCWAMPAWSYGTVEVRAGETATLDLDLAAGLEVNGVVVDAAGAPVGGASVEFAAMADGSNDAGVVATTAADGTFTLRACMEYCLVGARAPGHAASPLKFLFGKGGSSTSVRIVLDAPGGAVDGVVLAPGGAPVPDAVVRVGKGETHGIPGMEQGMPPLPAQVRTDETGRFHAFGVPAGEQPIMVRAPGQAPWQARIDVTADATAFVHVDLAKGVTCKGIVRGREGQPMADIGVRAGQRKEFASTSTVTAADGSFTLDGLPAGDTEVQASGGKLGTASARVHGDAGTTVQCDLQLSTGLVLRARLIDEAEQPVQARIECRGEGEGPSWSAETHSDAEGRFEVAHCPEHRSISVAARAPGIVAQKFEHVDPRGADLVFKVLRDSAQRCRVIGTVSGPDGLPLPNAKVTAFGLQANDQSTTIVGADGRFAIEVKAGRWCVYVTAAGYASARTEEHDVLAGGTLDVGEVRLQHGGNLALQVAGEHGSLRCTISAGGRVVVGLDTRAQPMTSGQLTPGNYLLHVHGERCAAQALPFTIREGETTRLELTASTGTRQRLQFVHASGGELPRPVTFEVRMGDQLLLSHWVDAAQDQVRSAELWFLPGSYRAVVTNQGVQGAASFVVGAEEGAPVRVEVR